MNLTDLQQIISLSGLSTESKSANRPTALKVVSYKGEIYKVRKYATASQAERQQELLAAGNGLFATCYGRIDRFLVLRFLDNPSQPRRSKDHLGELGDFLGDLASLESAAARSDDFDSWIEDLIATGLFLPRTVNLMRQHYERQLKRIDVRWGIEYFDAMPRNFVLEGDRLISIDEKHLRIGPKSVSLIKPMWELSAEDFAEVLNRYQSRAGCTRFDDPDYRSFLTFYYTVYGLAFVGKHKTKVANIQIPEFHRRRRQLLQIIGAPRVICIREQALWLPFYAGHRSWVYVKATLCTAANRAVTLLGIRLHSQANTRP
jgi:hypothetical protein